MFCISYFVNCVRCIGLILYSKDNDSFSVFFLDFSIGQQTIFKLLWLFVQSNPENTVGILTMAGKGVRVLDTPTSDHGKILACMHGKFNS